MALLDEGDEVIYPNPGFPIYESMIQVCGATAVPVPLVEERGFSFDLDVFRKSLTDRTKMVVLEFAAESDRRHDSGRRYRGHRGRGPRARSGGAFGRDLLPHRIWERSSGFDRNHAGDAGKNDHSRRLFEDLRDDRMAHGLWRDAAIPGGPVNKLMVNSNSCTASFTQRAGIAALRGPQEPVTAMVEEFRRRRDAFCAGLNDIPGWRCAVPGGAFYAFANVKGTGRSSKEVADSLLNDAGVACLNGAGFGAFGEGYIRFSYANSYENLMRAIERIKTWAGN